MSLSWVWRKQYDHWAHLNYYDFLSLYAAGQKRGRNRPGPGSKIVNHYRAKVLARNLAPDFQGMQRKGSTDFAYDA